MMKNHVAATPANYALWYTYVDNAIPQLNRELDSVVENFGICPPAAGEQLYNNYVASRSETDMHELRNSIEVLVNEVASSMTDTLSDTSQFSQLIDKSFDNLERVEDEAMSMDEVMTVIRQLVVESREIRHSTRFLNNQLETATKEINQLKSQLAEVQQDALFDSLTSLYNRRSFDSDINQRFNLNGYLFFAFLLIFMHIGYWVNVNYNKKIKSERYKKVSLILLYPLMQLIILYPIFKYNIAPTTIYERFFNAEQNHEILQKETEINLISTDFLAIIEDNSSESEPDQTNSYVFTPDPNQIMAIQFRQILISLLNSHTPQIEQEPNDVEVQEEFGFKLGAALQNKDWSQFHLLVKEYSNRLDDIHTIAANLALMFGAPASEYEHYIHTGGKVEISSLFQLIKQGRIEDLENLKSLGVDINKKLPGEMSLLDIALTQPLSLEMFNYLFDQNSDIFSFNETLGIDTFGIALVHARINPDNTVNFVKKLVDNGVTFTEQHSQLMTQIKRENSNLYQQIVGHSPTLLNMSVM